MISFLVTLIILGIFKDKVGPRSFGHRYKAASLILLVLLVVLDLPMAIRIAERYGEPHPLSSEFAAATILTSVVKLATYAAAVAALVGWWYRRAVRPKSLNGSVSPNE